MPLFHHDKIEEMRREVNDVEENISAVRLYRLGRNYYAIHNYEKAQDWLTEAVIRGNSSAGQLLFEVGMLFFQHQDYERAAKCFKVLADRGSAKSCLHLGFIYRDGRGRQRDVRKAFDYFNEAYQLGEVKGAFFAGLMILPDAYRYEEAKEAAIEWLSIAADGGIAEAGRYIGLLLCDNVPEHNVEALQWFLKAIKGGDVRSMVYASDLYLGGVGVRRNEKIAVALLHRAAELGDSKANMILGDMYASGTYVEKNRTLARKYYDQANK